jgi:hypothetical protein
LVQLLAITVDDYRVPDLQFNLLGVDVDHARPELHPDGEVVHGLEPFVGELQQQARLAYTCSNPPSHLSASGAEIHVNTKLAV